MESAWLGADVLHEPRACGLATSLNARTFADKGRSGVIDYLVHSRKHGWEPKLVSTLAADQH